MKIVEVIYPFTSKLPLFMSLIMLQFTLYHFNAISYIRECSPHG